MFTGSGMPMRFAKLDGTIIDCYQAATQMTDESGQSFPAFMRRPARPRARRPEGYYGVFTANMHTDNANSRGSNAIVASAQARGVPVVSAKQMLTWLDGRNGSSFGEICLERQHAELLDRGRRRRAQPARHAADAARGRAADRAHARRRRRSRTPPRPSRAIEYAFFPADAGAYVADLRWSDDDRAGDHRRDRPRRTTTAPRPSPGPPTRRPTRAWTTGPSPARSRSNAGSSASGHVPQRHAGPGSRRTRPTTSASRSADAASNAATEPPMAPAPAQLHHARRAVLPRRDGRRLRAGRPGRDTSSSARSATARSSSPRRWAAPSRAARCRAAGPSVAWASGRDRDGGRRRTLGQRRARRRRPRAFGPGALARVRGHLQSPTRSRTSASPRTGAFTRPGSSVGDGNHHGTGSTPRFAGSPTS